MKLFVTARSSTPITLALIMILQLVVRLYDSLYLLFRTRDST